MELLSLIILGLVVIAMLFLKTNYSVAIFLLSTLLVQYLYNVQIGILSGLDVAAVALSSALFIKLLINKRLSIFYSLATDVTCLGSFFLLLSLLVFGMIPVALDTQTESILAMLTAWAKFGTGFLLFWCFSSYVSDHNMAKTLFLLLPLATVIPIIWFMVQLAHHDFVVKGGRLMPSAGFHNPHIITYGITMLLPVAILNAQTVKRKLFMSMWFFLITVMLFITYRSYARTGWLAVTAQLGVTILLIRNLRVKAIAFGFLMMALPVLYYCGLLNTIFVYLADINYFIHNFHRVWSQQTPDVISLFSGRWGIWQAVIKELFASGPVTILFGRGIGGGAMIAQKAGIEVVALHNAYLVLLIDFGLLNFVVFYTLLGIFLLRAVRLAKCKDPFLHNTGVSWVSLLVGYGTLSLGTHICYQLATGVWQFWTICGINTGLYRIRDKIALQSVTAEGNTSIGEQAPSDDLTDSLILGESA